MYADPSGHMPEWLKWTIGGTIIGASIILTILTGGAAAGTIAAAVHTVATGVMIGSVSSATVGTIFSGITINQEGFGWSWDQASTGFMLGSITGTISGIFGGVLDMIGVAAESIVSRVVMSGVDGILGLGSYLSQNLINHTTNNISVLGAVVSVAGGLFDLCEPMYKWFDAFWASTIAAEIALIYDAIRTAIENKK